MIGDIILIRHKPEVIESEQVITVYCTESEEQERARIKANGPPPFFQYVQVKSRPVTR